MEQPRSFTGIAVVMALVILPFNCFAIDYTVGGSQNWDLGIDYATWASGKTFSAGDKLLFKYTAGMHDVLEVTKSAYDSCDTTNPTKTYTGGSNAITLSSAGAQYFICGVPGHCSAGMQLAISVAATSSASTPSVSPSSSPGAPVPVQALVPSPSPARSRSGIPSPSPAPTPSTPPLGSPSPASSPSISTAPVSASIPSAASPGDSGTKPSAAAPSFSMDGVILVVASLLFVHVLVHHMFSL